MRITKLPIVLFVILLSAICSEWIFDETNRWTEFPYEKFQTMLRQGTLDSTFDTVELPHYTNDFGRTYVHLWVKGDARGRFMFVPSDFESRYETTLQKTKAFRLQPCGNLLIIGSVLKILFFMLTCGALLFAVTRLRLNQRYGNDS
jgi:hypothetical protein